ncbi:LysR substrate-binding domain-containing protein [Kushneria sp. Sum13]|uniref:LysR substrate-binding domain-containing protein n=1 Tax=Kushneria sp. Sum13 TaxID=3459196 RepID=UPI0040452C53
MRMSPLPPLNALVAFEAAVRHMSFTRAASELNLSQSAVSRQIVHLEQFLGRALFVRKPRQLVLTQAGESYARHVHAILDECVHATAEVMKSAGENELTIACTAGTAMYWLTPRLSQFRREHSHIKLRLIVRDDISTLSPFEFDLGLYYLKSGVMEGFDTMPLMSEEVFPVCSPDYLVACRARHGLAADEDLTPAMLACETLLVLEDAQSLWIAWPDWFRHHGVTARLSRNIVFNHYPALVEMAILGQGVLLGWRHVIDSLIDQGRLLQASPHSASQGGGHVLLTPQSRRENHATRLFKRWLTERTSLTMNAHDA